MDGRARGHGDCSTTAVGEPADPPVAAIAIRRFIAIGDLLLIPPTLLLLGMAYTYDSPIGDRERGPWTLWTLGLMAALVANFVTLWDPRGSARKMVAIALDLALFAAGIGFWLDHMVRFPTWEPSLPAGLSVSVACLHLAGIALARGFRVSLRRLLAGMIVLSIGTAVVASRASVIHRRFDTQRAAIERIRRAYGYPPLWEGYWLTWEDGWIVGAHLKASALIDDDVAVIATLSRLQSLSVEDTAVTDAAVPHLERMRGLQHLYLRGSRISADGVRRLREALPGTQLYSEHLRE